MTPSRLPSEPAGEGTPSKPGRKLGPIVDVVGPVHRGWLEAVRSRLHSSGMTASDLAQRAGWSKSKVTELLRGAGLYPQWEITHALIHVLGMPTRPMRRLWTAAALEAQKKQEWIEGSIERVVLPAGSDPPPLDHQGFTVLYGSSYFSYAKVFLHGDGEAEQVVTETIDILWLLWEEALGSADTQKYAWQVLRQGVMARAPHIDGYPELAGAAFDTVALDTATGLARFLQLEESLAVFQAVSRLPDFQLDVIVLRYLRGRDESSVADILGVPTALVSSAERHAKRSLTTKLIPHHRPGGHHASDR
ncbi:helix-turn-helix domain-containing protein (plasmid) [Streptomyces sp. NBC_00868]|uniref:helix-turn-helix domain-containing protein n=1 Tax=Streptomyces sp. NBC_00868 TaxID=2903683 RepID=UPI002F909B36|nr:helix-turn-helix domain-containing protein [Streptomyces sp. NBC_00868]